MGKFNIRSEFLSCSVLAACSHWPHLYSFARETSKRNIQASDSMLLPPFHSGHMRVSPILCLTVQQNTCLLSLNKQNKLHSEAVQDFMESRQNVEFVNVCDYCGIFINVMSQWKPQMYAIVTVIHLFFCFALHLSLTRKAHWSVHFM